MITIRVLTTCKDFNLLTCVLFFQPCNRDTMFLERSWIRAILGKYAHTQDGVPHRTQGQGRMYSWGSPKPPGNQAVLCACLMMSSSHSLPLPSDFPKPMPTPRLQSQAWHMSSKGITQNLSWSSKTPGHHLTDQAWVKGAPLFNWLYIRDTSQHF